MAPINITCPNCQQRFAGAEQLRGRQVKCPACQTILSVPGGGPPTTTTRTQAAASASPPRRKGRRALLVFLIVGAFVAVALAVNFFLPRKPRVLDCYLTDIVLLDLSHRTLGELDPLCFEVRMQNARGSETRDFQVIALDGKQFAAEAIWPPFDDQDDDSRAIVLTPVPRKAVQAGGLLLQYQGKVIYQVPTAPPMKQLGNSSVRPAVRSNR